MESTRTVSHSKGPQEQGPHDTARLCWHGWARWAERRPRPGLQGAVERTWSGPLSNIFRVRGNCWEWGVYCTPVGPGAPGRPVGRSRPTGCLATSLVRLELLALDAGGEPLPLGEEETLRFTLPRSTVSSHRPPRHCQLTRATS